MLLADTVPVLFRYVYKGSDAICYAVATAEDAEERRRRVASGEISPAQNEIDNYVAARYVVTSMAMDHLFGCERRVCRCHVITTIPVFVVYPSTSP